MSFLTYLLISIFIHFTTGQITAHVGQGAINSINSVNPPFSNARSNARFLTKNTPLARNLGTSPAANLARNGFSNIANRNTVNTVAATGNTYKSNANRYSNSANIARLARNNVQAARSDVNNVAKFNLANAANSGVARSVTIANAAQTLPGNIASSKQLSQYRLGSPPQTYESGSLKVVNNLVNGNKASAKLTNGWYPNGNSYSQSALAGLPGHQQYGIHIKADALKIAGNVAVTGKLPFSGTVRINGRLPTSGSSSVNYRSSS